MGPVEVEQTVTDFLLTAREFPNYPDVGMLQCRKAMECILHHKYYEEYGEYPETDQEGKYPSLIKIWKGIEKILQKQTSEVIFSINSQTRGSLHWDFGSRNDSLKHRHVDAVIGQITNLFEDVFGIIIDLEGLKISDKNFENNIKIFVNEELTKEGITRDSLPSKENVDIEKLGTILGVAEAANRKGVEYDNWDIVKLGSAAYLKGELEISEGYFRQAHRKFMITGEQKGVAASLNNLGNIARTRGDLEEAERLQKESLLINREIGNREGEANSLNNLGNIAETRGDLEEAERLHKESILIKREIGNREGEAGSLSNLGNIAIARGNLEKAEELYKASLAIFKEIGNRGGEAGLLTNLGNIARTRGDLEEAERLLNENLAIGIEIGNRLGVAHTLNNLAIIARTRGDIEEALRLFKESLSIKRESGID